MKRINLRAWILVMLSLVIIVAALVWWSKQYVTDLPIIVSLKPYSPSELAQWPWPKAKQVQLHRGVTQWRTPQGDGTTLDLLEFDFATNSNLRWEIFDQDGDDEKPLDNNVKYWKHGAAQATKELNFQFTKQNRGRVVALWNGLFFGYKDAISPNGTAFHVSPVVLDGKVLFNTANHRWAFGVKNSSNGPQFKVFHLPSRATLEKEFEWAGGSAQCLIKDGKPLKLEPFPNDSSNFKKQPAPSTPQEVGHIPVFDHMRTCRASMAWTRDSKKLYLLLVKEPDNEAGSAVALKRGLPVAGGWTVPDLQRFWQSRNVWCAVNSDAGDVAQLVYQRPDDRYEMIPPRWASNQMRLLLERDYSNAPKGGSIMYFYVRDASARSR